MKRVGWGRSRWKSLDSRRIGFSSTFRGVWWNEVVGSLCRGQGQTVAPQVAWGCMDCSGGGMQPRVLGKEVTTHNALSCGEALRAHSRPPGPAALSGWRPTAHYSALCRSYRMAGAEPGSFATRTRCGLFNGCGAAALRKAALFLAVGVGEGGACRWWAMGGAEELCDELELRMPIGCCVTSHRPCR